MHGISHSWGCNHWPTRHFYWEFLKVSRHQRFDTTYGFVWTYIIHSSHINKQAPFRGQTSFANTPEQNKIQHTIRRVLVSRCHDVMAVMASSSDFKNSLCRCSSCRRPGMVSAEVMAWFNMMISWRFSASFIGLSRLSRLSPEWGGCKASSREGRIRIARTEQVAVAFQLMRGHFRGDAPVVETSQNSELIESECQHHRSRKHATRNMLMFPNLGTPNNQKMICFSHFKFSWAILVSQALWDFLTLASAAHVRPPLLANQVLQRQEQLNNSHGHSLS